MTRDYSQFLSTPAPEDTADSTRPLSALEHLGWQGAFSQQTDLDEMASHPPVRITEVNRNGLRAMGDGIDMVIPPGPEATVGDWLMLDSELPTHSRVLERKSLIRRRAPGKDRKVQLIAANIDTMFVVTSCNADFNVARLERFIAMAFDAEVTPVIVLTKIDLCEDPAEYISQARSISDLVEVVPLNAKSAAAREALAPWVRAGQTIAFLGTSGVGKSTLTKALGEDLDIATQGIREDDARGRHTTTRRQLYFLDNGCGVLDTPGMRELQLTDAASGVGDVFADLEELATQCRFRNCAHEGEPGCAVQAGIAAGEVDASRLDRWRKLAAEEAFNSASLAQRRAKDKSFGKMVKTAKTIKKRSRK
ncbi:ribosome small subunit-dependent GTPase A [Phaeobacter piscinae]|uniref:Small ribosomal subunit biogenesis GTPase RsgA n=1 Tax=Phaeobacter piscinae TaxID=1580596 RepID=A0AAN1GQ55_9RHOB|nr:ribosome small subunit-dependent GTPase A [Phaeobacter piscinae]ATG42970.1 ribosome small subunit-dependent GTPase A [Phaeobacter piscinae]AUR35288.1 ribosome small subunit-dependent GTPase A [Phaeobacter piscinae]